VVGDQFSISYNFIVSTYSEAITASILNDKNDVPSISYRLGVWSKRRPSSSSTSTQLNLTNLISINSSRIPFGLLTNKAASSLWQDCYTYIRFTQSRSFRSLEAEPPAPHSRCQPVHTSLQILFQYFGWDIIAPYSIRRGGKQTPLDWSLAITQLITHSTSLISTFPADKWMETKGICNILIVFYNYTSQ
jgi:hypothetical protein